MEVPEQSIGNKCEHKKGRVDNKGPPGHQVEFSFAVCQARSSQTSGSAFVFRFPTCSDSASSGKLRGRCSRFFAEDFSKPLFFAQRNIIEDLIFLGCE